MSKVIATANVDKKQKKIEIKFKTFDDDAFNELLKELDNQREEIRKINESASGKITLGDEIKYLSQEVIFIIEIDDEKEFDRAIDEVDSLIDELNQ